MKHLTCERYSLKEEETTTTTTTTTTEKKLLNDNNTPLGPHHPGPHPRRNTVTTVEETSTITVEELPNTGTGNQTIYMVIGALIVVAAVGVLVFAKKKDSEEEK